MTARPSNEIAPDAAPAQAGAKRAGRVLIVDDDGVIRYLLTEMLDTEYDVAVASSGKAALRKAHEFGPDVVITDLVMPDGDGWHLIRQLHNDPAFESTKIIAISGADLPSADVLDFGADDFVSKPFEADELYARVAVAMRAKRRLARLHGLLDALPIGVFLAEASGQLLLVNEPMVLMFDYPTRSNLCTKRIFDLIEVEEDRSDIIQALRKGSGARVITSIATHLGESFEADLRVGPVRSDRGPVTGFAGTVAPLL